MIERGSYGPVRVVAGRHKGKTGYYDDDNDYGTAAIVYFGEPFTSGYFCLRYSSLEPFDGAHLPLQKYARDHPDIVSELNVVVGRQQKKRR